MVKEQQRDLPRHSQTLRPFISSLAFYRNIDITMSPTATIIKEGAHWNVITKNTVREEANICLLECSAFCFLLSMHTLKWSHLCL